MKTKKITPKKPKTKGSPFQIPVDVYKRLQKVLDKHK